MGRLQRERDRETGRITGYILDGVYYTVPKYHQKLREMFFNRDPFARQVIEGLDDFRVLRRFLPTWKAEITASEAKAKGFQPIPQDPELVEAEMRDIDLKIVHPNTSEVDKVRLQRRRQQLEVALNPSRRDGRGQYRGLELTLERALGRSPTQPELDQFLSFLGLRESPSNSPTERQPVPQPSKATAIPAAPEPASSPRRTNADLADTRAILTRLLGRQPTPPELQDIRSVPLDLESAKKLDERLLLSLAQLGHPAARMEMRRRGLVMPGTPAESLVKNPIMRTVAGVPAGLIGEMTAGALQPKLARVAGEEKAPELTPAGRVLEIPARMVGFVVGPYKVMRPLATPITQAVVKRLGPKVAPSVLPYIAALSQGLGEGAVYGVLETMAANFSAIREIQRKHGTGAAVSIIAKRAQETALGFGISLAAMHGLLGMITKARLNKRALRELANAVREGAGK